MNYLVEEHRIQLYNYPIPRDSFAGLWKSIANRHHFLKLTFSESPTKEQIDHAIMHKDGSISPYSLHVFHKYEIIYKKKGTIIITNPSSSGTFFAVEDTDYSHRYFVGFSFSVGSMTESLTGLFVHFNEKGYCYSDQTIVCQRVLATYDRRNGIPSVDNVFLYHQTFIFTQIQCDTRKLMMYISYVPYSTEEIEDYTSYYTDLTTSSNISIADITLFHRFLTIPLINNKICLVDMGSLSVCEENHLYNETEDSVEYQIHRYFIFQSYTLLNMEGVRSFLEVGSLFPEKDYSDGYPIDCIKCHQKTVAATYSFKLSGFSTTYMGLGSSYCPECRIRFSDSKKSWVCAEVRMDGMICDGYFHTEWDCQSIHLHSEDQTIIILSDTPYLKCPYRKKICLQWIPSKEVMDAVQTARMSLICSSTLSSS